MKKRLGYIIAGAALAGCMAVTAAQAQSVSFWFAAAGDASGTAISTINVNPGATFNLSVWYKTDTAMAVTGWETLLGFDQSAAMGTAAVTLDNKLALSGDA